MRSKLNNRTAFLFFIMLTVTALTFPGSGFGDPCGEGVGTPPFLAEGVPPNLMLLIDNSASMYELAYDDLADPGFCNDDSYVPKSSVAAWADATVYAAEKVVSYNNGTETKWYMTAAGGTSSGTTPLDDTGVTDWAVFGQTYAGYFTPGSWYEWDGAQFALISPAPADAAAACSGAGTEYTDANNSDVCITINAASVTSFAAKGNYLNWAAASKFDVEKKILTGGKWDSSTNRLVMESRGCLGRKMIKQIPIKDAGGTVYYLTLGIKANSSDLTQIEIFEPTSTGFQFGGGACEAALVEDAKGNAANLAQDCMELGAQNESFANSNGAFNISFSTCWRHPKITNGNVTALSNQCAGIYGDDVNPYDPLPSWADGVVYASGTTVTDNGKWYESQTAGTATDTGDGTPLDATRDSGVTWLQVPRNYINAADSGYICWGNQATGEGYIGRCFNVTQAALPAIPGSGCVDTACAPNGRPYGGDDDANCIGGVLYRCPAGSSWNNGAGQCKQGPTLYAWEKQQTCGVGGSPATSLAGAWVAGYDSLGEDVNANEELDAGEDTNANGILDQGCIYMAIRDFCSPFYDPGVIDPASPVTSVADEHFPNLPAILMEIALQGQLREPIATLNGYIKQTTDPEGLIDDFAADIRIGAMQYNQMGTRSECDASPKLTHRLYDDCPASSQDGAKLIAYMDNGTDHTARLVQAINDIKANTWTPIAEAYYEALGYFTQQDTVALDMRFDDDDFLRDSDYSKAFPFASVDANYDPVPSWLSRRNIATAASDWTVVPFPLLTLVKDAANKLYWTNAGGTPSLYQRDGTTFATDVAEDTAVSWVPVDPVTNYCQKNNILIITDGGSTVDVHPDIISKIGDYDAGGSENAACGNTVAGVYKGYYGSTYLDDLAKYAYAAPATTLYKDGQLLDGEGIDQDKQNITTYVVTAGKLRVTGTDECSPDVLLANTATNGGTSLYASEDPEQLEANLRSVMESIRAGTASGSASSVISASRGGEGAIYQAIFWPRFTDEDIVWIGDVHSMFIDSLGKMYEDTDSDGKFDDDGTDKTVVLYYDESLNTTMACNDGVNADRDGCLGTPKALNAVNYLWSAAEWLSGVGAADITAQRADADYISHTQKRYIHTWIDLDNNGVADLATEWIPFVSGASGPTGKAPTPPHAISVDFAAADSTEVENIIDWVRGDNTVGPAYRDRERNYSFDSSVAPTDIIWRLGDVIHSTPMAVTRPSEGFHMLYGDDSYAKFAQRYNKRRHVIYFGSNDGILHAVNGGFYDSSQLRFCVTADCYVENDAVKTPASENKPELGAELWAYVPYNILPHLKCLTSPSYEHKYFVDLRPRIFDVQIFLEEAACSPDYTNPACFHPGGWGTIMVAGMRFGGAPIDAWTIDGDGVGGADQPTDLRKFISSYMVFDITDPEHPPTFLGELTDPDKTSPKAAMGYATVIPTVIPMYDNKGTATTTDDATYWYLVLGSGPTELSGKSEVTQFAKLAIYPLNQLTNGSGSAFMIPNNLPSTVAVGNIPPQTGVFTLPGARSFVSDPITVDFDLKENYMADAVYFGTVSGDFKDTGAKLGWGGKFYRLVTRKWDGSKQVITLPSDWDALLSAASLDNPAILADIGQPIVASPTVGSDRVDTWVYIGTGRFFDEFDKSDSNSNATQTFYGIKEPRVSVAGEFTWGQVALADLVNTSLVAKVASNANPFQASIYCINPFAPNVPGDNCPGTTFGAPFPGTIGAETFQDLVDYIKIKAGWKRNLKRSRERNLGQGTLLGGLLTFTTYQPFEDKCLPEGLGYLYGVYYGTGTAFHTGVFGDHVTGDAVQDVVEMGRGLSTTPNIHIGKAEGGKAFAQTSTGAIIEIPQPNLPLGNVKTGRKDWQELWQ